MILPREAYDASYFDGKYQTTRHNAGYSTYERWNRRDGVASRGEFWKDMAFDLTNSLGLAGKKVLELGCAKGFIVEDLRELGVDAYGMDWSEYAIGEADRATKQYLYTEDARTGLAQFSRNEFDFIISLRFMECLSDDDIPAVVTALNRVSASQFHRIDEFIGYPKKTGAAQFYNAKLLEDWLSYRWESGTVLQSEENLRKKLTK